MKRIRISTLMLLVVIVAEGLGLVIQAEIAARREARLRAEQEQLWLLSQRYWTAANAPPGPIPARFFAHKKGDTSVGERVVKWHQWEEARRAKYALAATHPWLPLPPDPPEPQ